MKFEGTKNYIATEDLKVAVNAAITLERPIIVKGEPGTGKIHSIRLGDSFYFLYMLLFHTWLFIQI